MLQIIHLGMVVVLFVTCHNRCDVDAVLLKKFVSFFNFNERQDSHRTKLLVGGLSINLLDSCIISDENSITIII